MKSEGIVCTKWWMPKKHSKKNERDCKTTNEPFVFNPCKQRISSKWLLLGAKWYSWEWGTKAEIWKGTATPLRFIDGSQSRGNRAHGNKRSFLPCSHEWIHNCLQSSFSVQKSAPPDKGEVSVFEYCMHDFLSVCSIYRSGLWLRLQNLYKDTWVCKWRLCVLRNFFESIHTKKLFSFSSMARKCLYFQ